MRRSRATDVAVLAAVAFLAAAIAWSLARRGPVPEERWSTYAQLTDASGVETAPSPSPDGEYFAYASDARGTFDIYVQRVGGRTPVLVAGDSTIDELWPAYSPDGKRIAYNVHGGGIFVVGATGESPRRLTTFGANPAWSPDGRRIVFGSEEVRSAYNVNSSGSLWAVDVAGGAPVRLDSGATIGLYQPAWSPSGARIAFWSTGRGQRDLETMRADGSGRAKVTDDAAVDFAPAWSADGKWLYFASDRGGTMGIWRVGIDESSGSATASPEMIASGVDVAMDLPHPTRDGTALLFRSKLETVNPATIDFDQAKGSIGTVRLLQNRTGTLSPTDVSPDGKWLALTSTLDRQQDIFVMRADGSGLTRLTDDLARDWHPRFLADGSTLVFYSNQSGQYDAWTIRTDGSARTRLSDIQRGVAFTAFAPDGKRVVASVIPHGAVFATPPWPFTLKTSTPVPGLEVPGGELTTTLWSRGGRWISGYIVDDAGEIRGLGVYDVEAKRVTLLSDDARGYEMAWLPGERQVVYFTQRGTLAMQDVVTLERRELTGSLPYPPDPFGGIVASPDGRTLYYGAQRVESNIWMVRRPAPSAP
jgi:Tol biopolymer transport system component